MFKKIATSSALALTLLAAPTTKMFAGTVPTPSAVTGGDPQPTGQSIVAIALIIPSLAVL